MSVQATQESRLFVIKTNDTVTTRGFDDVFQMLQAMATLSRLGKIKSTKITEPLQSEIGTLAQYQAYQDAITAYAASGITDTWYEPHTNPNVATAIERCIRNQNPIRFFYGDPETGCDWLEENGIVGRVSRSSGPFRCPILIPDGEVGGDIIPSANVLKIIRADNGNVIWISPAYKEPDFSITKEPDGFNVRVNDGARTIARFRSYGSACAYVAYMTGDSVCQPKSYSRKNSEAA